jgi:hypothetical protein
MYAQSVGFNPGRGLLSGLSKKGDVGAFSKGLAMRDAASLGMERDQQNQDAGVKQMQQSSQLRQQSATNASRRAENEAQESTRASNLSNRRQVFDIGLNYDYSALRRRQQNQLQQTILNGLAREF